MESRRPQPWLAVSGCLAAIAMTLNGCATSPAVPSEVGPSPGAQTIKVPGQLTSDGVECPALRADNGTVYTLLGDLKGFKAGDRVIVEGTAVEISFCMQGTTLKITQITRRPAGG